MEKEITTTNQTTALADSLIVVQQLPIIKEQLHSIKAQAQESVKEALSLACTEETLKVVKERRAALNRDRKDLDARRMAVKKQIMQPFEDFDEVYKECVTDVYGPADEALKGKITDVEAGLKADKEKKVKDYFAEMVKASGVEWVTYEDVGVAVTLNASLKSLKAKVKEYVEKVAADVACINGMENAPEIMAEYKLCGSLAVAINSVSQRKDRIAREEAERKQRLEAQLRAQEAEKAVLDVAEEELSAPQVMGTEPPVMDEQETEDSQKESTEQVMNAKFAFMGRTFQCRGTLTQLLELKSFVNDKVDEIQKYMDSIGIENQEVNIEGFAKGRTPAAISNEIQRRFDVTKSKANLLARDQVGTLSANLTRTRQESAGVEEYIWSSSGDERVRECHRELNGQKFRYDDPPAMWYMTKHGKVYSGRHCNPGEDYQCRCVAKPVFNFDRLNSVAFKEKKQ